MKSSEKMYRTRKGGGDEAVESTTYNRQIDGEGGGIEDIGGTQ